MAYEHKPGTFTLFKNDKDGNDKRPDYRGEGKDVAGNPIEVAAWLQDSAKGKYMACKITPKGIKTPDKKAAAKQTDDPDSIPF